MRFENLSSLAMFGLAASHAIEVRTPAKAVAAGVAREDKGKNWHPQTKEPHFFNLRVNDRCDPFHKPDPETQKSQCPFDSYAIRLEKGILVATPYNKWWDPKLPTLFVDDDTQLYTVSKDPLQLYVDSVTGAVKYTKVGWLPPSAISTGFYHTGTNPIQLVDPSPSYLTWPSTYGVTKGGNFALCPLGSTGQYQVFVNNWNFDQQGVEKRRCKYYALAALNANPWRKEKEDHWRLKARDYPTWGEDSDSSSSWGEDGDDDWSGESGSWGEDYSTEEPSYPTWEEPDTGYETSDSGYDTSASKSYDTSEDKGYETKEPEYPTWGEEDEEEEDGYEAKETGYPSYKSDEKSYDTSDDKGYETSDSSYDTKDSGYDTKYDSGSSYSTSDDEW